MKKFFNKLKAGLIAFRIALISFPLKVKWLNDWWWAYPQSDYWVYQPRVQWIYWVPSSVNSVDVFIKLIPRLLVVITFIVWIVSFIRIRKIDDKTVRRKKIKKAIIIISLLIILVVILLLLPRLLKKYW